MTSGSVDHAPALAPILVPGLGNFLLTDDPVEQASRPVSVPAHAPIPVLGLGTPLLTDDPVEQASWPVSLPAQAPIPVPMPGNRLLLTDDPVEQASWPVSLPAHAPILVLGLGNLLLTDDGVGLSLLARLQEQPLPGVEYVDGGTQGLALLGQIENRQAVLICDAVGLGSTPGTVHVLDKDAITALRAHRQGSAHEGNALELLEASRLLGVEPAHLTVVGVEPAVIRTGIGLSPEVEAALSNALTEALRVLQHFTAMPPSPDRLP